MDERASLGVNLFGTVDEAAPDDSPQTPEAWVGRAPGSRRCSAAMIQAKDSGDVHQHLDVEFGSRGTFRPTLARGVWAEIRQAASSYAKRDRDSCSPPSGLALTGSP